MEPSREDKRRPLLLVAAEEPQRLDLFLEHFQHVLFYHAPSQHAGSGASPPELDGFLR